MNYGKLPFTVDIEKIKMEYQSILKKVDYDPHSFQIGLNHRKNAASPFTDNIGSLYDWDKKQFVAHESDFSQWNEALKNSYISEIVEDIRSQSPFKIGRVRLMKLLPKRCLSFHRDNNIRIHIPIATHEKALMIFENSPPVHMPADGSIYWTDTTKYHTVLNGSETEDRVHLVIATESAEVPKIWQ